ncbi:hypothetical protein NXV53_07570 [Bacteroides faecis]|nr:hypothetical protein [Bacteroides faecis]MCS3324493.1 hypothetical protein [Bacteroides faecis]
MKTTTLLFICLLLTVGGQAQEAEKRPVWKVELAGALNNYSAWEVEPTITYLPIPYAGITMGVPFLQHHRRRKLFGRIQRPEMEMEFR